MSAILEVSIYIAGTESHQEDDYMAYVYKFVTRAACLRQAQRYEICKGMVKICFS